MIDGRFAIATAFTSGAGGLWSSLGSRWAYQNTEWAEDPQSFPLAAFFTNLALRHSGTAPVTYCGPAATPDLLVVFGDGGGRLRSSMRVLQNNGLRGAGPADSTTRTASDIATTILFVAPEQPRASASEAQDFIVERWSARNGQSPEPARCADLDAALMLVGEWADELALRVGASLSGVDSGVDAGGDHGASSIADLVQLGWAESLPVDAIRIFEPLLGLMERVLADDRQPLEELSLIERDRNSLRAELYETDRPDPGIVLTTTRRALRLLAALEENTPNQPLLANVLAVGNDDIPTAEHAIVIGDTVAEALLDAPPEDGFGRSVYEWLAEKVGWYQPWLAEGAGSAWAATPDTSTVLACTSGVLALLGLDGSTSVILGTYLTVVWLVWRPSGPPRRST